MNSRTSEAAGMGQVKVQVMGKEMNQLKGKRVAILATNGFEESELFSPRDALLAAGAEVEIVSPEPGKIKAWKHDDWGKSIAVDVTLDHVDLSRYDALMLPGGVMNPDHLRKDPRAVDFVRTFFESSKPIAAICHGPQLLIEAGVVDGLTLTSYDSIHTDLVNAGAQWVDEEVVVDRNLVTSRSPEDLPAFNDVMITAFSSDFRDDPSSSSEPVDGTHANPLRTSTRADRASEMDDERVTRGSEA